MVPPWLDQLCSWLKVTRLSVTVQTLEWVVPAVQTVHILAIAADVASSLAIALRALDSVGVDQSDGRRRGGPLRAGHRVGRLCR